VAGKKATHPANQEKALGEQCFVGIPLDNELRKKAVVRGTHSKGNSEVSEERMKEFEVAVERALKAQGAAPLSDGQWRECLKKEKEAKAAKAEEKKRKKANDKGKGKEGADEDELQALAELEQAEAVESSEEEEEDLDSEDLDREVEVYRGRVCR
jgi:hypothetical protein